MIGVVGGRRISSHVDSVREDEEVSAQLAILPDDDQLAHGRLEVVAHGRICLCIKSHQNVV